MVIGYQNPRFIAKIGATWAISGHRSTQTCKSCTAQDAQRPEDPWALRIEEWKIYENFTMLR